MKYAVTILAAVAVLLMNPVAAAAADESTFTRQDITTEPLVQRDLEAARAYWNYRPIAGCSNYRVEIGPTPVLAQTDLFGCVQTWNAELWAWFKEAFMQAPNARPLWPGDNPRSRRLEYLRWSCETTIHEMGHSYGLPDENTRGTIMYAANGLSANIPTCERTWRGGATVRTSDSLAQGGRRYPRS